MVEVLTYDRSRIGLYVPTRELIQELPKPELHTHLDGAVAYDLVHAFIRQMSSSERKKAKNEIRKDLLSERIRHELAKDKPLSRIEARKKAEEYLKKTYDPINFDEISIDEVKRFMVAGEDCKGLNDFLMKFPFPLYFMQTETHLYNVAYRFIEECHKDGITYVEVRFAPTLHTKKGLTYQEIFNAVTTGLKDAKEKYGVESRLIVCGLRYDSEDVVTAINIARKYKEYGIVAVDIAGPERGFPVKDHSKVLTEVVGSGLRITIHAGEAYDPPSIRQALTYGHANRIGHGTSLVKDSALFEYVIDQRIPLEVCVSSNIITMGISLESHPVRLFAKLQTRWFLNTDDRSIIDTTLTDEYLNAANSFGWGLEMIVKGILNGYKSAFLPHAEKNEMFQKARTKIKQIAPKLNI